MIMVSSTDEAYTFAYKKLRNVEIPNIKINVEIVKKNKKNK